MSKAFPRTVLAVSFDAKSRHEAPADPNFPDPTFAVMPTDNNFKVGGGGWIALQGISLCVTGPVLERHVCCASFFFKQAQIRKPA